ncbi:unnamed protein product [Orchesella dallaii]|uniref:C2H2-type domain-containing protein n=1 Tax=Orchesella dallaii TaxID=48710 RepID=A0ABP1R6V8_9HEXA
MICGICQFGNFELEALIKHVEDVHGCPGFRSFQFGRDFHTPCGIEFPREISQRGDHMPRSSYCHPATYNKNALKLVNELPIQMDTQHQDADDEDEDEFDTQDDVLLRYIPTQALSPSPRSKRVREEANVPGLSKRVRDIFEDVDAMDEYINECQDEMSNVSSVGSHDLSFAPLRFATLHCGFAAAPGCFAPLLLLALFVLRNLKNSKKIFLFLLSY